MTVTAPLSASHWRIQCLWHLPFLVLSKDLLEVVTLLTVLRQHRMQLNAQLSSEPLLQVTVSQTPDELKAL